MKALNSFGGGVSIIVRRLLLACVVVSLLVGCTNEIGDAEFTNPVYEPVLADPSIIKAEDGYFYAYGTEDAWGEESQTKFVPIVRSSNLVDWEYIGEAFEEKPNWKGSGNIWAPEITYYQDKLLSLLFIIHLGRF